MLRTFATALAFGLMLNLMLNGSASFAETTESEALIPGEQHPVYVQLIVKACPAEEAALEPTGQGKIYNDEKPVTLEERNAALRALGCVDVPVPMEFLADAMTPAACMGHAGYIAAMQFLQQRQDLAKYPAVGAWQCVITDHEVIGAAAM
ncbi:MAG: hypothetical protein ACREDO_02045 [Methyloceanibacter sp.]